jgi:hypothetical protein
MSKKRGSYSRRRTEISRDEMRETLKLNQIDAHENKALLETLKSCERFHASRGLSKVPVSNDFRKVVVTVVNLKKKEKESTVWSKKQPTAQPTKSLKAAFLREIAMAARRAGLIRDGYHAEEGMEMVEWHTETEE